MLWASTGKRGFHRLFQVPEVGTSKIPDNDRPREWGRRLGGHSSCMPHFNNSWSAAASGTELGTQPGSHPMRWRAGESVDDTRGSEQSRKQLVRTVAAAGGACRGRLAHLLPDRRAKRRRTTVLGHRLHARAARGARLLRDVRIHGGREPRSLTRLPALCGGEGPAHHSRPRRLCLRQRAGDRPAG